MVRTVSTALGMPTLRMPKVSSSRPANGITMAAVSAKMLSPLLTAARLQPNSLAMWSIITP